MIIIDGIRYSTLTDAAEKLGMSKTALQDRVREESKSNLSDYPPDLVEEYQALTEKQFGEQGLSEVEIVRLDEVKSAMDAADSANREFQQRWSEGKQEVERQFAELRKMIEALPA
jgi:hypothetical protein